MRLERVADPGRTPMWGVQGRSDGWRFDGGRVMSAQPTASASEIWDYKTIVLTHGTRDPHNQANSA
jgi:hypothetical protein